MKVNSFDILKEMNIRDMDIRMSRCGDNLVGVRKTKLGGQVTIGVDDAACKILMDFALGTGGHNAVLLMFSNEQFNQVKAELEAREDK
jgi:hypothetical protein